jgi:group I intron endonuclease
MQLIYRLTSPSGKVYIGQTKHLSERMSSYRNLKCKPQLKLYRSLLKYGFDNHELYIVHRFPETVKQEIIDAYEVYVIKMHKMMGLQLLNITDGGRGFAGLKPSENNRKAILASTQGQKHKLSRLMPEQVLQIRGSYKKGQRGSGIRQFAREYNVSERLIYNIVNNKTWKHL